MLLNMSSIKKSFRPYWPQMNTFGPKSSHWKIKKFQDFLHFPQTFDIFPEFCSTFSMYLNIATNTFETQIVHRYCIILIFQIYIPKKWKFEHIYITIKCINNILCRKYGQSLIAYFLYQIVIYFLLGTNIFPIYQASLQCIIRWYSCHVWLISD